MKIAIELEYDESWSGDEELSTEFILENSIDLKPGVTYRIIYDKNFSNLELDKIEKKVCSFLDVLPEELQIKSRKREVLDARQICQYLARKKNLGSFESIGKRWGNQHHATVMNSFHNISGLLACDKQFKLDYGSFINSFFPEKV